MMPQLIQWRSLIIGNSNVHNFEILGVCPNVSSGLIGTLWSPLLVYGVVGPTSQAAIEEKAVTFN
jgi:hypothetical protein